ncbi:MAG: cbb3-type cytochrome c oxidase subunit I [Rhodospirillales bacterium]|jgi:hypothetical protein|nr:cbb3-type cytochrome c oxidase subunit I [Rhodospirillales bacterium]MDP6775074.1 cbb3-type cytochrome c oxidase subunit I [Rhodospirillales bacterium]
MPETHPSPPPPGFADAVSTAAARRELWGWSALAISSLAVAGVFALLLALSRTPGLGEVVSWPAAFFHKGLVIHVVFSFVVWFLAVFGALLHLATARLAGGAPRLAPLGILAVWMAVGASVLLFAPAFLDRGEPTLNDYVPAIVDPLYYAGLVALAGALALAVLRLLVNLAGRRAAWDPFVHAIAASGFAYLVALLCFGLAYWRLADDPPSHAFNEDLFWGGGHVLQFVNVGLLVAAWWVLAAAPGGRAAREWPLTGAAAWIALFALPGPFLYFTLEPFSGVQAEAFTDLQYALAPPAAVVAAVIGLGAARRWRAGAAPSWKDPAFLCLALSFAVFATGGVLGLFVDGADTRTPAHYHGVIAGINLAFMGLFFVVFLPLLGRPPRRGKLLYAQVWLFAGGQTVAALGLFWAGGYGAPRKTAGAAQGLDDVGAIAGMALNGVGALLAVLGGVLFIWTVAAALLRKPQEPQEPQTSEAGKEKA